MIIAVIAGSLLGSPFFFVKGLSIPVRVFFFIAVFLSFVLLVWYTNHQNAFELANLEGGSL